MEDCIQHFVSQLRCTHPITADATMTVQQRQFLIASLLPADDSWQHIPELIVRTEKESKGREGALIKIERL